MPASLDFGVCRLAIVPVHEQPDYRSLQTNQILFGEHYAVTGTQGNWVAVKLAFDGSTGWIPALQHHSISHEYFEQINSSDYKITTDITATLLFSKNPLSIVMGSIVPISNSELFKMEEQLAFMGESKTLSQKRDAEYLNTVLMKYLNAPYLPGGKSPFGIDAPGLVQMAFKICGYKLPRTSTQQMQVGASVENFDQATDGDILILKNKSSNEIEPAILQSSGKIIQVHGHVRQEHIEAKGIKLAGQKKYSWEIEDIRRVIG